MAEKLELTAILKLNANEFLKSVQESGARLTEFGKTAEQSGKTVSSAIPKDPMKDHVAHLDKAAAGHDKLAKAAAQSGKTIGDIKQKTDDAANSSVSAESGFSKLTGTIAKVVAVAASAKVAFDFLSDATIAAAKEQRFELATEAHLKALNTDSNSGMLTTQELNPLIEDVTKTSFTTVDQARDAISSLARLELPKEQFKSSIDVAKNLAEVLGVSMPMAAYKLQYALESPASSFTAFTQAGVSFTSEEKEKIEALQDSGELLEAQQIILEKLNGSLGNAAVAAASGYEGAVDQVDKAWERLLITVGKNTVNGETFFVKMKAAALNYLTDVVDLTINPTTNANIQLKEQRIKSVQMENANPFQDIAESDEETLNGLRDQIINRISAYDQIKAEMQGKGVSELNLNFQEAEGQLKRFQDQLALVDQTLENNGFMKYGADAKQILAEIARIENATSAQRTVLEKKENDNNKHLIKEMLSGRRAFDLEVIQNTKFKVDEIVKLEEDLKKRLETIEQSKEQKSLSIADKIRAKGRVNMTDAGKEADIQAEAQEKLAASAKALEEGDTEKAKKLAEQAENLAGQVQDYDASVSLYKEAEAAFNASLDKDAENAQAGLDELATQEGSTTKVEVDISEADAKIEELKAKFEEIKNQTIKVEVELPDLGEFKSAGKLTLGSNEVQEYATGGQLSGFGGGDRIPALLEAGEFVINKDSTRQHNNLLHLINYFPEQVPRFSTGGGIGLPDISLPDIPEMPQGLKDSPSKSPEIMVLKWENGAGQTGQIKTFLDQREELVRFTSAFKQAGRGT